MFVKLDVMLGSVVGSVQIVRVRRVFGGESINTFHKRRNAESFAMSTDCVFGGAGQVGNLLIGETHLLGTLHKVSVDLVDGTSSLQSNIGLDDVIDLVQKPLKISKAT